MEDRTSPTDLPLLAAIRVAKGHSVDDILASVADALRADGLAVTGFIQHDRPAGDECCGQILLEDLASGETHVISQALGSAARGCRLDPQALAAVAGPLRGRIETEPDFLILNRFGKGESEGQGFRAAIEEACARGVPLLTAVRDAYVEAWQEFAGDLGLLLPPEPDRAIDWARRAASVRTATIEPA
jgi:nucleoside-triphosphatase THEP1